MLWASSMAAMAGQPRSMADGPAPKGHDLWDATSYHGLPFWEREATLDRVVLSRNWCYPGVKLARSAPRLPIVAQLTHRAPQMHRGRFTTAQTRFFTNPRSTSSCAVMAPAHGDAVLENNADCRTGAIETREKEGGSSPAKLVPHDGLLTHATPSHKHFEARLRALVVEVLRDTALLLNRSDLLSVAVGCPRISVKETQRLSPSQQAPATPLYRRRPCRRRREASIRSTSSLLSWWLKWRSRWFRRTS